MVVSVDDFALRPARGMGPEDVLTTGQYRFRFYPTPLRPPAGNCGLPATWSCQPSPTCLWSGCLR